MEAGWLPPQEQPPEPEQPEKIGVSVRYNEDADQYELGAELDGEWTVFASAIGPLVETAKVNARENEQAKASGRQATAATR